MRLHLACNYWGALFRVHVRESPFMSTASTATTWAPSFHNEREHAESLSRAVSLSVLEIDADTRTLIPAFLLANLMSPAIWAWRTEKRALTPQGTPLSPKSRLDQLQRFFHRYTFTIMPNLPGGDVWGLLNFAEEASRFPPGFVSSIRTEYDATLRKLLVETPESQFGQIVTQPYYQQGYFPRLKNETVEVMNAMAAINHECKRSGKCIGLSMLWAAALVVWGRFPLDKIIIAGNRAHMFVYLDVEDGHLLNNTKWFSSTRIDNGSELSEFAKAVASGTETTFFYNPAMGMCHCTTHTCQIPRDHITALYNRIGDFVSNPLKHPNPDNVTFVSQAKPIPDPSEYDSAEDYQRAISTLAKANPGSIFEHALFAFRSLNTARLHAYAIAATRDWNTRELAKSINNLDDALSVVGRVASNDSIFGSRDRIAMPDEVLLFGTGTDRDRALLLYTILNQSPFADKSSRIGFAHYASFVKFRDVWINSQTLTPATPLNLLVTFDSHETLHLPLIPPGARGE